MLSRTLPRVGALPNAASTIALLLLPELPHARVAHQLPGSFVPQAKGQRFRAGPEGDGLYLLEQRITLMTFLQIVVGNSWAQMVDVMKADIA